MDNDNNLYLGDESVEYEGGHLLHNLMLFGRVCRLLGMDVTPNRMMEVARALNYIRISQKRDVYHLMRSLIVKRHKDISLFDEAFKLFWKRPSDGWIELDLRMLGPEKQQKKRTTLLPPGSEPSENQDEAKKDIDLTLLAITPTYSVSESLRRKHFAELTGEELLEIKRAITKLPKSLGERKTRRYGSGKGIRVDMRKAMRQNMRYASEPIELPTRRRKIKPRPLVLICDISGSMERYTRILLHLIHTLSSTMYQVESFLFSTRLTRITHPIRHNSVDKALQLVGADVQDWGSGTKTGDALKLFNQKWSRRVLGQGAIVMIITDGWDRGDTDELKVQMKRLQMSCHRLIWLNPLLSSPEYEPLTKGAQAMLPYIDDFLPIHNLASLEMVIEKLRELAWKRSNNTLPDHFRHLQQQDETS